VSKVGLVQALLGVLTSSCNAMISKGKKEKEGKCSPVNQSKTQSDVFISSALI